MWSRMRRWSSGGRVEKVGGVRVWVWVLGVAVVVPPTSACSGIAIVEATGFEVSPSEDTPDPLLLHNPPPPKTGTATIATNRAA
ncbi:hypothetical protein DFH27DRAFT_560328 [Peziza echinospora]|nr:hypothetical protein DFH27DRAFT_560328 [Peziza echinospora]